ncbi:hypothetical protein K443DRAFT_124285 [Laccaria amethystina LaAM-08-1]|uniref:Uncharacterized protein n=1 Tax=Laccaria amethystina LaAM-08-1 TaxID=1095629 RepID=A0A0C9WW57_9AGAR|nr:hypothetical protein K443DRAFT_124285 [Laccaria amethystina LaAM-08-1]
MYRIYCVLNRRPSPPTTEEIVIASGKKPLSEKAQAEYIKKLKSASENIKRAFEEQEGRAVGPWDQEKFESLLTEWIIACDQPFHKVEKPEFIAVMNHAHHGRGPLNMPKHEGMKQSVMKMGEDTIEDLFR